ncbi:MAG: hypothetical protein H7Y03_00695 [Chitinophagaceae bacterium]|nr:hypothetical protein [Chitinophagaceae bacterium]
MKKSPSIKYWRNGLVAFFLLIATASMAQHKTAEERAKLVTDSMKTSLVLNEEQYQKAYTANLHFMTKAADVRKESGDRASKVSKLKALNKDRDDALKTVLTEAQYAQFQEQKKDNRKEMRGKVRARKK